MPDNAKVCFVVMGFGKKQDFESGRVLDLDKTYRSIIKPAVKEAGLKCVRADEIVHSGVIDLQMYEQLLTADVVIADLSTSNKNVFYELGVRHALRPYTTIVIAEDGIDVFPFDLNSVNVFKYRHLGEHLDYEEVVRFQQVIATAIKELLATQTPQEDSPVYTFLKGLKPPAWENDEGATRANLMQGVEVTITRTADSLETQIDGDTYSGIMQKVDEAEDKSDFKTAKTLLARLRAMLRAAAPNRPEDPTLIQRYARATYLSEDPDAVRACLNAIEVLKQLKPETSNDTQTLGLWGAVHKYVWSETREKEYLDQAIRAYSRGFYLRSDFYNGINYAYLLNGRVGHAKSRAEAIADFVEARRVREEVLAICEPLLTRNDLLNEDKYWVRATMAEAYLGLEDQEKADQKLKEAEAFKPLPWMKKSREKQLAALKMFLANSPLDQAL